MTAPQDTGRREQLLRLVQALEAPPTDDRSVRAYALLGDDLSGGPEPWTAAAERAWAGLDPSADPWVVHHLAVATHARAFDLEAAGAAEAERYWRAALRYWSVLLADDRFWAALHDELNRGLSRPAGREVVDGARRDLPGRLLEPHLTRIGQLVRSDPAMARVHAGIVREAPFAPEVVAEARRRLVRPIVDDIPRALREEAPEQVGLATVRAWLEVDEDNEQLLWALLRVLRARLEPSVGDPQDRAERIRDYRRFVEGTIGTRLSGLADPGPGLREEMARFAFWLALEDLDSAEDPGDDPAELAGCHDRLRRAERRFARARELDPSLELDPLYRIVGELAAEASANAGIVALRREDASSAVAHLDRALAGGVAARVRTRIHLAQALVLRYETAQRPDPPDLDRAATELDAARPDADRDERSVINDLRTLIARLRRNGRGDAGGR